MVSIYGHFGLTDGVEFADPTYRLHCFRDYIDGRLEVAQNILSAIQEAITQAEEAIVFETPFDKQAWITAFKEAGWTGWLYVGNAYFNAEQFALGLQYYSHYGDEQKLSFKLAGTDINNESCVSVTVSEWVTEYIAAVTSLIGLSASLTAQAAGPATSIADKYAVFKDLISTVNINAIPSAANTIAYYKQLLTAQLDDQSFLSQINHVTQVENFANSETAEDDRRLVYEADVSKYTGASPLGPLNMSGVATVAQSAFKVGATIVGGLCAAAAAGVNLLFNRAKKMVYQTFENPHDFVRISEGTGNTVENLWASIDLTLPDGSLIPAAPIDEGTKPVLDMYYVPGFCSVFGSEYTSAQYAELDFPDYESYYDRYNNIFATGANYFAGVFFDSVLEAQPLPTDEYDFLGKDHLRSEVVSTSCITRYGLFNGFTDDGMYLKAPKLRVRWRVINKDVLREAITAVSGQNVLGTAAVDVEVTDSQFREIMQRALSNGLYDIDALSERKQYDGLLASRSMSWGQFGSGAASGFTTVWNYGPGEGIHRVQLLPDVQNDPTNADWIDAFTNLPVSGSGGLVSRWNTQSPAIDRMGAYSPVMFCTAFAPLCQILERYLYPASYGFVPFSSRPDDLAIGTHRLRTDEENYESANKWLVAAVLAVAVVTAAVTCGLVVRKIATNLARKREARIAQFQSRLWSDDPEKRNLSKKEWRQYTRAVKRGGVSSLFDQSFPVPTGTDDGSGEDMVLESILQSIQGM